MCRNCVDCCLVNLLHLVDAWGCAPSMFPSRMTDGDTGRVLAMRVVVQRLVQCVVVLYLVTHGLPIVTGAELRDLASAMCTCVLAQLRLTG